MTIAERKDKGLCLVCGYECGTWEGQVCSLCKRKAEIKRAEAKSKKQRGIKPPRKTIDEVQERAEMRGISYGQMVARIEGRTKLRTDLHDFTKEETKNEKNDSPYWRYIGL